MTVAGTSTPRVVRLRVGSMVHTLIRTMIEHDSYDCRVHLDADHRGSIELIAPPGTGCRCDDHSQPYPSPISLMADLHDDPTDQFLYALGAPEHDTVRLVCEDADIADKYMCQLDPRMLDIWMRHRVRTG